MAALKFPLIIIGISVPVIAGLFVGGGGVGLAAGALVAAVILVVAARQLPHGPIDSAPGEDGGRHLLLVVTCPVEEPEAVAEIVGAARLGGGERVDVLVLAPARISFLDRWTSDVEPARHAAQESLVATVAALAKSGVKAEARVGDEDIVQAVEDQLQTFPATEVVLVSGGGAEEDAPAAEELRSRLEADFDHVILGP